MVARFDILVASFYVEPVRTEMDDRLRSGIPPRYVTKPTTSTQLCILPGPLNRVPALIALGYRQDVTSHGWKVRSHRLCDVSSRSGGACCELQYPCHTYFTAL